MGVLFRANFRDVSIEVLAVRSIGIHAYSPFGDRLWRRMVPEAMVEPNT